MLKLKQCVANSLHLHPPSRPRAPTLSPRLSRASDHMERPNPPSIYLWRYDTIIF
jgi:hypothetical protein